MDEQVDRASSTDGGSVTPERFARVRAIFEAALEQPSSQRGAFVKGACVGEPALLREVEAMLAADATAAPLLDRPASPPSSSAPDEGRFPAGTVLAGRYRILGRLGQGGMGEVYRAHDLILNQTVALKFLAPAHLSEAALARFRNEVRIARQVSHPNVCRVYDLGMVEGLHFLSMEYIDGEDLASLLRRIGRLPQDKAIEFTRKICAGLGAAHERGVLHRDLKPANIMIDGRGQPRITDFGLAGLAAEIPLSDLRSGTPAYMSPEQKAGKDVTIRSDLYSLGLVLHEMFTGKARKDSQSSPSTIVKELDPAIERLILRCLDEDPKRRPTSALSVAIALPGADPIAAALAAGETPSPEMVAASQEKEGFSPRTAVLLFVAIVIAAGVTMALRSAPNSQILNIARVDIPPEALAFEGQDIVRRLGYPQPPRSRAYGFECCDAESLAYANRLERKQRDQTLASHQPPLVRFWYRQHTDRLFAPRDTGLVAYDRPAHSEPGMIRLLLDAEGRLIAFEARPMSVIGDQAAATATFDWSPLFTAARLDPSRFSEVPPQDLLTMPFDTRSAWVGSYGAGRTEQVRVEAAAWQGRAVYFSIGMIREPAAAQGNLPVQRDRLDWLLPFLLTMLVFVCVSAALVARHNLRAGRVDRNGARRVAVVVFVCGMFSWGLTTTHVPSPWEVGLLFTQVGQALEFAGLYWLGYIAVEPYMRRYWPESLISWNRLHSGRVRDPLVASHVMAGIAAWGVTQAVAAPMWQLLPLQAPENVRMLDGTASFVAFLGGAPAGMLAGMEVFLVLVVVLRLLTRDRAWIAEVLACVMYGLSGPIDDSTVSSFALSAAAVYLTLFAILWLIRRFGFVAMLSAWLGRALLMPLVLGSWYTPRGLIAHFIPVAVAAWALWVILSDRRTASVESVG